MAHFPMACKALPLHRSEGGCWLTLVANKASWCPAWFSVENFEQRLKDKPT